MMLRVGRFLHRMRHAAADVLLVLTLCPAVLALFLWLCMCIGCVQRTAQTWAGALERAAAEGRFDPRPAAASQPADDGAETRPAPLMGPPDPADDTRLLGQQVGALNLQLQSVVKNTLAEFRSFLEHLEVRLTAKVEAQVQASVTGAVVNTKQDLTWKAVALVLGLMLIGTAFVAFFVLRLVRALHLSSPVAVFAGPRKGVPP